MQHPALRYTVAQGGACSRVPHRGQRPVIGGGSEVFPGHQPSPVQWLRFHAGQRAGTLPAGGAGPAGALSAGASGDTYHLQVGLRIRVLWGGGVPFATSESQRHDDLLRRVQRRRSEARFASGRGLCHCCVAVPESGGWSADLLWLSPVCSGPFCCTCPGPGGVWVAELEHWLRGLVPSVASRAPLGARLPMGVSGAPPPPASRLWGGQPVPSSGEVAFLRFEGRLVSGAFPLRAACPWGRAARTRCRVCPRHGWCGGPSIGPASRAHKAPPGGAALRRCEGRLRSGARPPLAARPQAGLSGSATHVLWARACSRSGPALSLWLACPARGCVPRSWWKAVPGGRRSTMVRGDWCQALFLSRLPVPGGGQPGPIARVSRARVVWETQHRPRLSRTQTAPGGGCLAPLRGASEVRRSSSPGCSASGRAVGVRYPHAVGAGVQPFWPSTVPLACMPCWGLRAAGLVEGRPGGPVFNRCEGRPVSGAVPPPAARPWGRAARTRCPCVPGTARDGMGDPAPARQRALLQAGIARCGGGRRASPWALRRCEGRLRSGARPPLADRPRGGLSGSATHLLWARPCGRRGPALSLWRACPAGGRVPRGWWVAVKGAVAFHCFERPLVSGAVTLPAARPWSGRPGPVARMSWARLVWAWGTQHRLYSVRTCKLAWRAVGMAGGRPLGGVPCAAVEGVWVQALALTRMPVLSAGCRGPLPTYCGPGCASVGPQDCSFGLHALRGAACRGGGGRPSRGGWPSAAVRGVWCHALSLPRPPVPWGGQPGFHDPSFPGVVGVGVGTQHLPHSARSCELSLRAVGLAGGRLRGGGGARHCEGAPGVRRSPSPGCPSVGRAARARCSLALGAGAWAWVCRPSAGRAAGLWCGWCLCGACVLVVA